MKPRWKVSLDGINAFSCRMAPVLGRANNTDVGALGGAVPAGTVAANWSQMPSPKEHNAGGNGLFIAGHQ